MKYTCLIALLASFIAVGIAQEGDDMITNLPPAVDGWNIISRSLSTQEQTTNKAGESVIPVVETIGTSLTTVFYTIIDVTTMSALATECNTNQSKDL